MPCLHNYCFVQTDKHLCEKAWIVWNLYQSLPFAVCIYHNGWAHSSVQENLPGVFLSQRKAPIVMCWYSWQRGLGHTQMCACKLYRPVRFCLLTVVTITGNHPAQSTLLTWFPFTKHQGALTTARWWLNTRLSGVWVCPPCYARGSGIHPPQ